MEYKQKSNYDERWIQKKTTLPRICLASDPAMEVRVTMDTCIGRSDFSPVLFVVRTKSWKPTQAHRQIRHENNRRIEDFKVERR